MQKKIVNIIMSGEPNELLRQLNPENSKFVEFTFQQDVVPQKCDFLVVLHRSGLKQQLLLNGQNVPKLYISLEPNELKNEISARFLNQFDYVWSSDKKRLGNLTVKPTHTWWLGFKMTSVNGRHVRCLRKGFDFNYFAKKKFELPNNERILVISTTKMIYPGHKKRGELLEKLLNTSGVGNRIDVFGQGYKSFDDKYDLILQYKYVLIIENECKDDYWTEKLADVVLLNRHFIYVGCTNINDYFPTLSGFIFDDYDKIVARIRSDGFNNEEVSVQAKNLVIGQYNLITQIIDFVMSSNNVGKRRLDKLKPNFYYILRSPRIIKVVLKKLQLRIKSVFFV